MNDAHALSGGFLVPEHFIAAFKQQQEQQERRYVGVAGAVRRLLDRLRGRRPLPKVVDLTTITIEHSDDGKTWTPLSFEQHLRAEERRFVHGTSKREPRGFLNHGSE